MRSATDISSAVSSHQDQLQMTIGNLASVIDASAESSNSSWPFYSFPSFEVVANGFVNQAGVEQLAIGHVVPNRELQPWNDFVKSTLSNTVGGEDVLQQNGYKPFVSRKVSGEFLPDLDRSVYYPGASEL